MSLSLSLNMLCTVQYSVCLQCLIIVGELKRIKYRFCCRWGWPGHSFISLFYDAHQHGASSLHTHTHTLHYTIPYILDIRIFTAISHKCHVYYTYILVYRIFCIHAKGNSDSFCSHSISIQKEEEEERRRKIILIYFNKSNEKSRF